MMAKIKVPPLEKVTASYTGAASRAGSNYREAVSTADWESRAKSDAAEKNFAAAMQIVIQNKLRQKGLADVTNAEWQKRAVELGAPRLAQGIAASGDKFSKGIKDVLDTLAAIDLPERVPNDPIANLTNRAGAVVKALANMKRRKLGLPEIK